MRTRGEAHEQNRRRILEAARSLVFERGHENLSLRAVATRAGFSPASLYEYFESKEEIVRTLAAEANASLWRALREAVRETRPGRDGLIALGRAYVSWAKTSREDFLLLFSRLPSGRRSLEDSAREGSAYKVVLETLARAVESGDVRLLPGRGIEEMAYGLWALAHGMAMLQLTHLEGFRADFEALDEVTLTALVDGWR